MREEAESTNWLLSVSFIYAVLIHMELSNLNVILFILHIYLSCLSVIYPAINPLCELHSLGHTDHRDVCTPSYIIEVDGTLLVVLKAAKKHN